MVGRFDRDTVPGQAMSITSSVENLTDEQREAIFAQRAEELAARWEASGQGAGFEALVFPLGAERYAFATTQVQEVRVLDQLTPLPGTPPFIAGLVNIRGRVVPVLDLRPLFGLPVSGQAPNTALLLSSGRGLVGVQVSSRPAIRRLPNFQLGARQPQAPPGMDAAFIRGITPDLVVVLDADRLLADRRLLIEQES